MLAEWPERPGHTPCAKATDAGRSPMAAGLCVSSALLSNFPDYACVRTAAGDHQVATARKLPLFTSAFL